MTTEISSVLLSQLSKSVARQMGLHFPRERWADLERGIRSAAREFDFEDVESCIQWLISSQLAKKTIELLASYLTIGETYFFRENKTFKVLEEQILPELIRSRRQNERYLRIWSAGCATGEEPYSIAILLRRMIPNLKDWNITILATDINPRFLEKASEGIYSEWSFRDTPTGFKEQYFIRKPHSHFQIPPNVKKMVTFSYLNLVEDTYPSILNNTNAMDIIFCRNVLMYFVPKLIKETVQKFCHSLIEDGWLIVGQAEVSHIPFPHLSSIHYRDAAILYRKDRKKPQAVIYVPPIEATSDAVDAKRIVSVPPPVELVAEPKLEVVLPQFTKSTEAEKPETKEKKLPTYEETLVLYEQGRYTEVADTLLESVLEKQDDSKSMALLARAYANQGKLAEAVEWCKKAITTDKLNPSHYYLLAIIMQEQGQMNEVVTSLRQTLYLDPNFVLAHFDLGNLTQRQGKLKESQKHFENALLLLKARQQDDILLESEGITAGRLIEIIQMTTHEVALV